MSKKLKTGKISAKSAPAGLDVLSCVKTGFRLGINWNVLRVPTAFFFSAIVVSIAFLFFVATFFASSVHTLLSMTVPAVISFLAKYAVSSVVGAVILLGALWVAYMWIEAYLIGLAQNLRAKKKMSASTFDSAKLTASNRFTSLITSVIISGVAGFAVKLALQSLLALVFTSGLVIPVSVLFSIVVSSALMLVQYRCVASGVPPVECTKQSVQIYLKEPLKLTLLWLSTNIAGGLVVIALSIPLIVCLFGLVLVSIAGGVYSTNFWLVFLALIPSAAVCSVGLAFSKLLNIGALELANFQLKGSIG